MRRRVQLYVHALVASQSSSSCVVCLCAHASSDMHLYFIAQLQLLHRPFLPARCLVMGFARSDPPKEVCLQSFGPMSHML